MSRENEKTLLIHLTPEVKKLFHLWVIAHDTTMQDALTVYLSSLVAEVKTPK